MKIFFLKFLIWLKTTLEMNNLVTNSLDYILSLSMWIAHIYKFFKQNHNHIINIRSRHDRMVIGFTTTYAICLSPLKLWIQIHLMVRCTRYLIILAILYTLIVELWCSIHSYMLCTINVSYNTCNTIPSYWRIMMYHT